MFWVSLLMHSVRSIQLCPLLVSDDRMPVSVLIMCRSLILYIYIYIYINIIYIYIYKIYSSIVVYMNLASISPGSKSSSVFWAIIVSFKLSNDVSFGTLCITNLGFLSCGKVTSSPSPAFILDCLTELIYFFSSPGLNKDSSVLQWH